MNECSSKEQKLKCQPRRRHSVDVGSVAFSFCITQSRLYLPFHQFISHYFSTKKLTFFPSIFLTVTYIIYIIHVCNCPPFHIPFSSSPYYENLAHTSRLSSDTRSQRNPWPTPAILVFPPSEAPSQCIHIVPLTYNLDSFVLSMFTHAHDCFFLQKNSTLFELIPKSSSMFCLNIVFCFCREQTVNIIWGEDLKFWQNLSHYHCTRKISPVLMVG